MASLDLRNPEVGSPEWWLRRLLLRLETRRPELERMELYYQGRHPLNFFDEAIREKFGNRFRRFASNFTALVVDGLAERLEVAGFRFKDPQADDDLWQIWQENDLDGGAQMAHSEALIKGAAYALVEPQDAGSPRITIEDSLDCIVETDPRDRRRRRAGLKRWVDDDGRLTVYLYLPDEIHVFRSVQKWPSTTDWLPTEGTELEWAVPAGGFERVPTENDEVITNTLGVVPLVPILNRPRLGGQVGRSEIAPVTSNQDLINYYRAMAVVGARYVAVPQRWARNLDLERDPATGQYRRPFSGFMDLWTVPSFGVDDPRASIDAAQTEFGQFEAADLSPYLKLIGIETRSLAAIAGFPAYYLLDAEVAGLAPPSGESIKASEARLTKKLRSMQVSLGEGWEEVERTALRAMQDERADIRNAETRWVNPEVVNEAVRADAVVKQLQIGVIDLEMAQEQMGYSIEQITRMAERRKARAAAAPGPIPPPATSPGTVIGAGFTVSGGVSNGS